MPLASFHILDGVRTDPKNASNFAGLLHWFPNLCCCAACAWQFRAVNCARSVLVVGGKRRGLLNALSPPCAVASLSGAAIFFFFCCCCLCCLQLCAHFKWCALSASSAVSAPSWNVLSALLSWHCCSLPPSPHPLSLGYHFAWFYRVALFSVC